MNMGFFDKVLVRDKETGNLIDVTDLDQPHYENFLNVMHVLNVAYKSAIDSRNPSDTNDSLLTTNLIQQSCELAGQFEVTACCKIGPITNENYCPNCGNKIKR